MAKDLPHALTNLALKQYGNVSRRQLLELGLGSDAIAHRLRSARLHRVHLGVYAVGRPPKTALEHAAAALLACGPTAALSHASAAALWALTKQWPRRQEVTVTTDRRPRNILVHRSSTLTRKDLRTHYGIRATTPARTLLDIAPRLSDAQLTRMVNDALLTPYLRRSELLGLLERRPNPRLAEILGATEAPTRSQLEDEFIKFCESHGLPRPRINARVCGREVDAYFEAERLIVELDGYKFHSSPQAFERDRNQDAIALSHGIGTVRLTRARIQRDSEREARRLEAILRRRGRS